MHTTHSTVKHQHNRIKAHADNSRSDDFFNILTSDALLDKVEALLPDHRERLYPPTETLSMFLAQAMNVDRSCQNIVNQTAIQKLCDGLAANSVHTGGYCRARQRLPMEMVSQLTQHLGEHIDAHTPNQWRWEGRRVRVVDGTTVTMPDTAANQALFPSRFIKDVGM